MKKNAAYYKRNGYTITDATETLTFNVHPKHIRGARCRDRERCAIARTIVSKNKVTTVANVGPTIVLIGRKDKTMQRFALDIVAREAVKFFDENPGRFAPTRVTLRPVPPAHRIGYRKGIHARSGPHNRNRKIRRRSTR